MAEQMLCALLAHDKFLRDATDALAPLLERAAVLQEELSSDVNASEFTSAKLPPISMLITCR
jgi:hypothetical protein